MQIGGASRGEWVRWCGGESAQASKHSMPALCIPTIVPLANVVSALFQRLR